MAAYPQKDNIDQKTLFHALHQQDTKGCVWFNKLKHSIYILKCILDPHILIDAHRSQNRVESYHTLRAAIAKAGGRKALIGRTYLEQEISNQCGRLIAQAFIYYNMCIHSAYLNKHPHPAKKILKFLKKSSPVAWQHIHFTGHFTFYNSQKKIDINKLIENLKL